ncbi:transcriptional regulator [Escherichia coli]|nr:transcriptional regulator [Escherichia coli]
MSPTGGFRYPVKEIWDYLTHDEQELFEVINKKLLAHFSDASS